MCTHAGHSKQQMLKLLHCLRLDSTWAAGAIAHLVNMLTMGTAAMPSALKSPCHNWQCVSTAHLVALSGLGALWWGGACLGEEHSPRVSTVRVCKPRTPCHHGDGCRACHARCSSLLRGMKRRAGLMAGPRVCWLPLQLGQ
jgi:hypothetical protein